MRKTLLAVGIAVLVSMMLAPHGGKYGIEGFGPFFSSQGFTKTAGDLVSWLAGKSEIFYGTIGRVMIDMLVLEIIFLGVLFAIIANIWRRKPKSGT